MWPDSPQQYSFLPYPAVCLFVYSTSEVKDCPGYIKAQTQRPRALQRLASCCVRFRASIILCTYTVCTYGQLVSLGLVSLQILFGGIASWLVCRILSSCWLNKQVQDALMTTRHIRYTPTEILQINKYTKLSTNINTQIHRPTRHGLFYIWFWM